MAYVIGVDVGGTFTDAVLADDAGTALAAKPPSTPPDYSRGVLDVLTLLAEQLGVPLPDMLASTHHIAHGTTSSLNALVTGNVPPVGFLTTKGHRDSIFIMNVEGRYLGRSPHERQNVLGQTKDHAVLPKRHALEVTERVDRDGTVVVALDEDQARAAIRSLLDDGIRAIAVSLLWSFRNPAHERRLRELVAEQDPAVFVALSSEISPRIREFSRNATTIMSTQIGPGLRDYLTALEDTLRTLRLAGPLLVMQSNGGAVTARGAPAAAISTICSVLTRGLRRARRDQHHRLVAHRRRRRLRRAGPPARSPQHHLHRRGRYHVPGRPDRRRRARPGYHPGHQPPPHQRPHAPRRRDRLRRRRDRLAGRGRQPADRPAQRAGRPRPRLLRQRRQRADQHRRQPGPGHPARAGPAPRADTAVPRT